MGTKSAVLKNDRRCLRTGDTEVNWRVPVCNRTGRGKYAQRQRNLNLTEGTVGTTWNDERSSPPFSGSGNDAYGAAETGEGD